MKHRSGKKLSHLFALALVMVAGLIFVVWQANAQSADSGWTLPVNLSKSGAADTPRMVVDAGGMVHVLWLDKFAGFAYTRWDGQGWSPAAAVELPFGTRQYLLNPNLATPYYNPDQLYADAGGRIHAFWRDETNTLFYSKVAAAELTNFQAWTARQQLSEASLDVSITADTAGRLHMAYIRPIDSDQFPAGVYYRQSVDSGDTWSNPVLLYGSPYFRSLGPASAQIQLTTVGEQVIAAWDVTPLTRIYVSRSGDAGATWDAPVEVDRRLETDTMTAVAPAQPMLFASGNTVHLVWQAGHEGLTCGQFHQWSEDGGVTWQLSRRMLAEFDACPTSNQFLVAPDGMIFLLTAVQGEVYLVGWNGIQWGAPLRQSELLNFTDPETFWPVTFGCRQAALVNGGARLLVVGCDAGDDNDDIWVTSRAVADSAAEPGFLATPVWQAPGELASSPSGLYDPFMVADGDGRFHAFWSQAGSVNRPDSAIHYAYWDGVQWSDAAPILRSSEGNAAVQPAVIVDNKGRLQAVWASGQNGGIYFSQAAASRAIIETEWFAPRSLPAPRAAASSPDLVQDREGVIYVVYTIAVNEERGVYLTKSTDDGSSWSLPVQIFDGVANNWAMVGVPRLTISADGQLHLLWSRHDTLSGGASLGLYYAFSQDGGQNWSVPAPVSETPVTWYDITAVGDQLVHRFWQDELRGTLWHEVSLSDGLTWEPAVRVSGLDESLGPAALTLDAAGRPHLVHANLSTALLGSAYSEIDVQHWLWDDDLWTAVESLKLEGDVRGSIDNMAAAVSAAGDLGVIYTAISAQEQPALFYSSRGIAYPGEAPTPLPTLTSTPLPLPTGTPQPTAEPTPTVAFSTEENVPSGPLAIPVSSGNSLAGSIVGIIPAGIIVLIVFFVGIRLVRGGRR